MQPKKFSEYTPIEETDGSEIIPIVKGGQNATVEAKNLPVSEPTQAAIDAASSESGAGLAAHLADTDNPHEVTKAQVGLPNVDNTSDANKPVSTAQATAIAAVQADVDAHEANTANPHSVTKSQVGLSNVDNTSDANKPISSAAQTALDAKASAAALASHEANISNPHSVTKAQIGLGNADNTSDANKPVSTATQTALNAKANDSDVVHDTGDEAVAGVKTFSSSPIVPEPTTDSQAATKKYVDDNAGSGTPSFEFGAAIDTTAPPAAFENSTNSLSTPSAFWGALTAPYPTNVWWQNLVLGTSTNLLVAQPYQLKALTTGLDINYPKVAYGNKTVAANGQNITTAFHQNIRLGMSETITARAVTAYDDLTVTERFTVSAGSTFMDAFIAKGSPYVTVKYTGLTPRISTQHAISNVNGTTSFPADITSDRFEIVLNNGQTWIIYFESSVTLNVQNSSGWRLLANASYTGIVRVAIRESADDELLLDTYKNRYVTAGAVDCSIVGDQLVTNFNWSAIGNGPLLMLALPHHQDAVSDQTLIATGMASLKGPMKAIVGDQWIMRETLPTIEWNAPRPIDADKIADIQTAFDGEKSYTPTNDSSPYTNGKELSKAANLALVGEVLGDETGVATLITNMKTRASAWLGATNTNKIKYDTTWRGIATTNGLASGSADFGNGLYNDHHFHWGYHIYSAAVIARNDPSWAATYLDNVNTMIRDIMNPSNTDTYFPRFRMMDWFDGHSWAHGLSESASAKDQESFSEAVNAWYACVLWGLAIGDDNIYNHARIMLKREVVSFQRYMQIKSDTTIYESPFNQNKIGGILFASKVDHTTFFGNNLEYILEINTIPITAISEEYLTRDYVEDAYSQLGDILVRNVTTTAVLTGNAVTGINITSASANNKGFGVRPPTVSFSGGGGTGAAATAVLTNGELTSFTITNGGSGYSTPPTVTLSYNVATDPWKGFVIGKRAVYDKETAWTDAAALASYDGGQSETNLLYWIATRDNSAPSSSVTSVNSQVGDVVLDADDIDDASTTNKFTTASEASKLAGIEALADVTDSGNVGTAIHGSTGKTTPVDADTLPIIDSEASNVLKKVTWANVKATLKSYFDTVYAAISHTHAQSDITNLTSDLAAKEELSNKDTDSTFAANSDTKYPSQKAVKTAIDGKQPLDSDLTTLAGLTATTDNFIQSKSSAWSSRTPTEVTADLIAMVGDSGSGGSKGLVPAPAAGDAAANKFLKADGTWAAGGGSGGGGGVETIDMLAAGTAQALGTGQTPHYVAYFHNGQGTISVDRMTAYCGTLAGSGTVYMGIYDASKNRLASGSATLSATGLLTITLSSSVSLVPGTLYYFAILNANANDNAFMCENTDLVTGTFGTFLGATSASSLPSSEATANTSNRGVWMSAWKS